jgi:hypothetical protein
MEEEKNVTYINVCGGFALAIDVEGGSRRDRSSRTLRHSPRGPVVLGTLMASSNMMFESHRLWHSDSSVPPASTHLENTVVQGRGMHVSRRARERSERMKRVRVCSVRRRGMNEHARRVRAKGTRWGGERAVERPLSVCRCDARQTHPLPARSMRRRVSRHLVD